MKRTENGSWRFEITCVDGQQRTFKLNKRISKSDARAIQDKYKRLAMNKRLGTNFCPHDQGWIAGADQKIRKQLIRIGVISKSDFISNETRLKEFTDGLIERLPEGTTRQKLKLAAKRLLDFLGNRNMRDITKGDAQRFLDQLLKPKREGGYGLARNSSARRMIAYCVQIWNAAIDYELITKNPFRQKQLPRTVQANSENHIYVSIEKTKKLFYVIPRTEDRLRLLLMRIAGFRAPSELNALRWKDIDWTSNKMSVKANKTSHCNDGGRRTLPIFPEILPLLRELRDKHSNDDEFVLPRISHAALTRKVKRWISKIHETPWPKLLYNLRRSAVTDKAECFPSHVINGWFGHTERISQEHYRMTLDSHFDQAASQTPMF